MEYRDFERIMSKKRMGRYLTACGGDTRKAMTLYRYNLHLTQDVFTVISCFGVALRNAIDARLVPILGEEWLKDSVMPGCIFDGKDFRETRKIIERAYTKLVNNGTYSHSHKSHEGKSLRPCCHPDGPREFTMRASVRFV